MLYYVKGIRDGKTVSELKPDEQKYALQTNKITDELFLELKDAKHIFSGHEKHSINQVFTNEKYKFKGQPDYILKSSFGKIFVIEEKYLNGEYTTAHVNHKAQLASYITLIEDFGINHGYLVYWNSHKSYDPDERWTTYYPSCDSEKVFDSQTSKKYITDLIERIRSFIATKSMPFDIDKINTNKCVKCPCNKICGHKTKRFSDLSFPYSGYYTKLYKAKFPAILKRPKNTSNET